MTLFSMMRGVVLGGALVAAAGTMTAAAAGEVTVAAAANFTAAANEIAAAFKDKTGHEAVLVFGSSGKLYTQIANDAPFEVFLSADVERPLQAEAEGRAVAGSRFTYAIGRLALHSAMPGVVDADGRVLAEGNFGRLAIANPETAPYGVAAMEVLGAMGLAERLAPKIVRGDNLAQVLQFVSTGNAEVGFVALSQVIGSADGSSWVVPETLYQPIRQDAVLLKKGDGNPAATAFLDFLKDEEARALIVRFGYGVD
ncbi:MAG: molybdate ABC transporter substrate-binding protein [Hyphomicrobiales bacterium]